MENPFLSDVCRTPWHAGESVQGLNVDVLDQLVDVVGGRSAGPMMLLTAPRAGYGKTHLLGRVAAAAANQAVIVPVAFKSGDSLTLASLSRRGIESLADTVVAAESPGWSRLRESAAQVVMGLLRRLIENRQLPCANAEQAVQVLAGPVQDVFDPTGKARRIGEWIIQNREGLRGPLAMLAAREVPLRAELLDGWMGALLEQGISGGLSGLAEMQELAGTDNDTGVPAWLRLVGLWRPVVLLVDHLDGFYRHPDAGVKIASMLMELVESHRLHVLLSLNQDVWQATFGHHLPSALEDRLTASQVLLRGLTESDANDLLRLRLDQGALSDEEKREFEEFVSVKRHFLGRPIGSVSARAFLRHCARQWEIFQSAPPSPVSTASHLEASGLQMPLETSAMLPEIPIPGVIVTPHPPIPVPASPNPVATSITEMETASSIPLMTETVLDDTDKAGVASLPPLFDEETASDMQTMAEGLAEPRHALPQDEPTVPQNTVSSPEEPQKDEEPSAAPQNMLPAPIVRDDDDEENSQTDWNSVPVKPAASAPNGTATPTADAFVKLREMLAQLRQPNQAAIAATVVAGAGAAAAQPQPQAPEPPFRAPSAPAPMQVTTTATAPATSHFQPAHSPPVPKIGTALPPQRSKPAPPAPSPADALLGRFQALRLQHQAEALSQPLDHGRLADLIRLAGRRFPLVRYSEHELPGLPGRYVHYWALQGLEILFGLASFNDTAYWRTLCGFAAGRLTDLGAQAERERRAPARLKVVGFKTEREQLAWQTLVHNQFLPEPIRLIADIVHLDTDGLASLYAMQRIIKESESGTLQAEPAQVISVLARELDFFWKRITRVL
ncbi:MAG: hypothetical protein V4662_20905 [Verrucomicrobiota bacterium]